jgi:hypothetical protein
MDTSPVQTEDYQTIEARPINDLRIYLGEQIGIVGATGTGKTVFTCRGLLKYMQKHYPEVPRYIVDSTADPDMDKLVPNNLHVEGNKAPDLLRESSRTLIWTPDNSKIPSEYNRWFNRINDSRKPAIVVIDEIASMTKEALEGLETLFKQLRKHGGTVIGETQEIAKVDTTFFRQLTHFFQFTISPEPYDLNMARKYLAISKEEYEQPSNKYGFHYRRTRGNHKAIEFVDMHHFFGESIY